MKSRLTIVTFVLAEVIGAAALAGQDSPYTLKVDVAMVSVDVAVFDSSGAPVTSLRQEDFQIFEDGRPQQIQSFASSESPYNVLLIIDQSGSMHSQIRFVSEAVNRFFSNLRPQDEVAMAGFDTAVHSLMHWRSVQTGSKKTINIGAGGNTDVYGALDWASKELRKVRGRKAALIFTDGEDYRLYDPKLDGAAFRKTLQTVRRTRAPFHFVGLGADPVRGGAHIRQIAEETGGHAYFPKKIEEIVPLYDQISRELGISYTLGYVSDRPARDGGYRSIKLAVPGREVRISASRMGYTAN
jgi:VWFA-related protein